MAMLYLRLTQLLTLELYSREMQSGPITLRKSLKSVCVYRFFAKILRRLSKSVEFIRKFTEARAIFIILYWSSAIFPGLLKQDIALLGVQSSSSVMHVVWVSATSQISPANVTPRHPPPLRRGFLQIISTLCMSNHQRQGHTPPPGAVSSCFDRRLLPIGTLFCRHCHGCWLTEALNWTNTCRNFLDVYLLLLPPPPHPPPQLSEVCRRRSWEFYSPSKINHSLC